jgi:hypothetical protein
VSYSKPALAPVPATAKVQLNWPPPPLVATFASVERD